MNLLITSLLLELFLKKICYFWNLEVLQFFSLIFIWSSSIFSKYFLIRVLSLWCGLVITSIENSTWFYLLKINDRKYTFKMIKISYWAMKHSLFSHSIKRKTVFLRFQLVSWFWNWSKLTKTLYFSNIPKLYFPKINRLTSMLFQLKRANILKEIQDQQKSLEDYFLYQISTWHFLDDLITIKELREKEQIKVHLILKYRVWVCPHFRMLSKSLLNFQAKTKVLRLILNDPAIQ